MEPPAAEQSEAFEWVVFRLVLLFGGFSTANHINASTGEGGAQGGRRFVATVYCEETWLGLEPNNSQVGLCQTLWILDEVGRLFGDYALKKCFHLVKERSSAQKRVQLGGRPKRICRAANELSRNYLL